MQMEVEHIVETYDFIIEGCRLDGFKRVSNWEGFAKFLDDAGRQIIAFKNADSIFTQLLKLDSEKEKFILVTATPAILKEIQEYKDQYKDDDTKEEE